MWIKEPADSYKAYERFLRKGSYRKAYQCLERLQHEFPKDEALIEQIIDLCLSDWQRADIAMRWLIRLTKMRSLFLDHLLLSRVEAELYNIPQAKKRLKEAKALKKQLPSDKQIAPFSLKEIEEFIKYKEWQLSSKPEEEKQEKIPSKRSQKNKPKPRERCQELPASYETKASSGEDLPPKEKIIPSCRIPVKLLPLKENTLKPFCENSFLSLKESQLLLDFTRLIIQGEFNELLCLSSIKDIEKYWYQIETVKKVLKHFHGRVLLCDEVGLGKTIEAGMLIKEYLVRNMAKNVLILAPPALVSQWKEEMQAKFDLDFKTTDDIKFSQDPQAFWKSKLILASIHTAKNKKNVSMITKQFYDIVVVDEAHHLRNRTTQTWKAVNLIPKKFMFLLTATPVQNNLVELFNLITLLKPGQFKTEKVFKKDFLTKGDARKPANKDKLRELLKDIMIRNTRSAIDLKLPKRFAVTLRIEPTDTERKIYDQLNLYIRNNAVKGYMANLFLRQAGSSLFALGRTLSDTALIGGEEERKGIVGLINDFGDNDISKGHALIDLVKKNPHEKKIIFTQYLKSMDYITALLTKHRLPFVIFRGNMSSLEKNAAIGRFKDDVPILVSTESGGEGRNIQFCNTIINFDLPWNPMRIEQRIGRLHRIGQTRDVFIFNLSVRGTIEDYIIDILDNKLNMFEMVIGEIEPIIGQIDKDKEFEEIITEIWMNSKDTNDVENKFEQFAGKLITAKQEYLKAKALDQEIFGEDYET